MFLKIIIIIFFFLKRKQQTIQNNLQVGTPLQMGHWPHRIFLDLITNGLIEFGYFAVLIYQICYVDRGGGMFWLAS